MIEGGRMLLGAQVNKWIAVLFLCEEENVTVSVVRGLGGAGGVLGTRCGGSGPRRRA